MQKEGLVDYLLVDTPATDGVLAFICWFTKFPTIAPTPSIRANATTSIHPRTTTK